MLSTVSGTYWEYWIFSTTDKGELLYIKYAFKIIVQSWMKFGDVQLKTAIPSPEWCLFYIRYENIHFQYYRLCNHCTQESHQLENKSLGRLTGIINGSSLTKTSRSIGLFFFFIVFERTDCVQIFPMPMTAYFLTPEYCHISGI